MPPSDDVVSNASSRRSGRGGGVDATAANSSTQLIFPESTATRVLTQTFPLFSVLLSYRQPNVHLLSIIGMVLYALQQWAFLLNPRFAMLWRSSLERVLVKIMYATQLNVYDRALVPPTTVTVDIVLAYALLVLVGALITCILLERRKKDDEKDYSSTSTNIARVMLDVASSALLVPIVSFCFSCLVCDGDGSMWRHGNDAHAVCWQARHIAVFVPALLTLLLLLPLVYVKVACVYDYSVLITGNFLVQRHTLVEQLTLVLRVCSCFLYNVMIAYDAVRGFACVQAIFALVLIAAYAYFLPYCVLGMNQFYVAVHACELVAAILVAVQVTYYNQRALYSPLVSFVCFGVAAAVLLATVSLHRVNPRFTAALRIATYGSAPYRDDLDDDAHDGDDGGLDDDDDDDVMDLDDMVDDDDGNGSAEGAFGGGGGRRGRRCRGNKGDADGDAGDGGDDEDDDDEEGMSGESAFDITDVAVARLPFPRGLDVADEFTRYSGLTRQVAQSIMVQKMHNLVGNDGEAQKSKALPVLEPFVDHVYTVYDVNLAVASIDYYARRFGVTQVSSLMIMFGVHTYSRALARFPRRTYVMQRLVGFIVTYVPGMSFMAVDVLKQMLRLQPTLDERFCALKQIDELRAILGIRTHAHGMRCSKARTAHARVLQSLHRFWSRFIEPSVNIRDVSRVADDIHHRRRVAIEHFGLAIEHQQSADYHLLHQLGDFFGDVMMAPDAAQECYIESREVYQARQARGMRGTRKNLAEIDVDALKKRILRLLHYHEHGGVLGSRGSASTIWRFVVVATTLFVLLLACAIAFVVLATTLLTDVRNYLRAVDAAACVRSSAGYFSAYATTMTMVDEEAYVSKLVPHMTRQVTRFAQSIQTLTSAASAPRSATAQAFLTSPSIPFYTNAQLTQTPSSLLRLAEYVLREANALVATARAGRTREGIALSTFLVDSHVPLAAAADTFLRLLETDEGEYLARKWVIGIFVVFLVNAIVLCVTYAVLVLSFRRTSLRRVFVFQLFTLIPYESVERLAMSMKERYYQMHQEKVLKRAPAGISDTLQTYTTAAAPAASSTMTTAAAAAAATTAAVATTTTAAAGTGGGGGRDEAHAEATSTLAAAVAGGGDDGGAAAAGGGGGAAAATTAAVAGGSSGGGKLTGLPYATGPMVLKSCLRKPRAPAAHGGASSTTTNPAASVTGAGNSGGGNAAATRHVRFNPVVVVVGGEADDDAAGGGDRGGDGGGGGAGGAGGGDKATSMAAAAAAAAARRRGVALSQAQRYSRAAARKAAGMLRSGHAASLLTLLYLCLFFVCVVVVLCMLVLHDATVPSLRRRLDTVATLQHDVAMLGLTLETAVRNAFVYLDNGNVLRYMQARVAFAETLNKLPTLAGPDVPTAALRRLFDMHRTVQTLANATVNASVLMSMYKMQRKTRSGSGGGGGDAASFAPATAPDNTSSIAFLPEMQPWANRSYSDVAQTMRQDNRRAAEIEHSIFQTFTDVDADTAFAYAIAVDAAATAMPTFHAAQSAALQSLAAYVATAVSLRSVYTLVAVAFASAALGVSLLLALTPLGRLVDAFVTRPLALLASASLVPVFVLVVLLYVPVLGKGLRASYVAYSNDLRTLSTTTGTVFDTCILSAAYVATLNPLMWFRADAARQHAEHDVMHETILDRYLDESLISAYDESTTARRTLLTMSNVSAALTISALDTLGNTHVEDPQRAALNASWWDVELESGYVDFVLNNYAPVYYSNKPADLAKPAGTRYAIAQRVLTSEQYRVILESFVEGTTTLYDAITANMRDTSALLQSHTSGVMAAEVLCAVPLFVVLLYFYVLGMRMLSNHFVAANNNSNSSGGAVGSSDGGASGGKDQQQQSPPASAMEEPTTRFRHTMQRVRLTLLLLCALCCATFAVGIWLSQVAPSLVAHQRHVADERAQLATSSAAATAFASPHSIASTTSTVTSMSTQLASQLVSQTLAGSAVGVPGGLRLSRRINVMLYGDAVQEDSLKRALSWLQTVCGTFCSGASNGLETSPAQFYGLGSTGDLNYTMTSDGGNVNTTGPGGSNSNTEATFGVHMPVLQSVVGYVLDAARVVFVADMYAMDVLSLLHKVLPSLFTQTTNVLAALTFLSDVLLDVLTSRAQQLTRAFIALAVAQLVVTVAVYALVIVPIIVSYFREERASRLLLQMIPAEVRDQVPAITHHVETGEMTNVNELRMKFEANERLLQNILPPQIAARLKGGELPIADTHACVTMLFTDFVGFTKRSSTMRAREIVDFLNEVFLEFDTIVELLGLEKIKTIGDAFLMAGGLDPQVQDHALRVVEAGLMFFDALDAHNRRHPTRAPLQMRLGVHSGPVVAGVIGVKKVVFDLWGESVEIANAMESTGVPGCVHISEDTARLVRGFFRLVPRGPLPREKEHIPEQMPATYLVAGRLLPTPYMNLRRPKLLPISLLEEEM